MIACLHRTYAGTFVVQTTLTGWYSGKLTLQKSQNIWPNVNW